MEPQQIKEAGERLAAAWISGGEISPREELRPRSRGEAYAIQAELARALRRPVVGWKLGATSPAVQRKEGNSEPTFGRIFEGTLFESPAEISGAEFTCLRAECEFAFELTADLPARRSPYTLADARSVSILRPAIEIVRARHPNGAGHPARTLFDEIADNTQGAGLIIGAPLDAGEADLAMLEIDFRVDGGPPAANSLGPDRCVPLAVLLHAVNTLSAWGIGLKKDQIVSTGGVTALHTISGACTLVARYGSHGEVAARFG